jgi:tripeptidyl-peptidase-1
MVYQAFTKLS